MDLKKIFLSIGTGLFDNIITESSVGNEKVVYMKSDTTQFVSITRHADGDRDHRRWWVSYKDPNFINFVDMSLSILNSMFKRKLEIDNGIKSKDNNPHLEGVQFIENEQFGFCNKERTLGLATALRKSEGRYYTSFTIVTILNKNSPDMDQTKNLFIKGFANNHEKVLHNFRLVTESTNGNKIHIIEMDI